MRNFRPTNSHGTAFAPKQWLHQKEATEMESSKMQCTSWCRNHTYLCEVANYSVPWGGSIGPRREICETSDLPTAVVPDVHQSNGYIKRKLREWRAQKCNALVGAEIALTCAGSQTTPFQGGSIRPRMEICEASVLPTAMVPCLHQNNAYMKRKVRE